MIHCKNRLVLLRATWYGNTYALKHTLTLPLLCSMLTGLVSPHPTPIHLRVLSFKRSVWNLIFPQSLCPTLPRALRAHVTLFGDRAAHLHPFTSQRLQVSNIRIDYSLLWLHWHFIVNLKHSTISTARKCVFCVIDSNFFTKWEAYAIERNIKLPLFY